MSNPPRQRLGSFGLEPAKGLETEKGVSSRLGDLHIDILSAAEVVKQVQEEVAQLKQENESLRQQLSLANGEERGLRSTAGSTVSFKSKTTNNEPLAPAVAPALMEIPHAPTDPPATVLPFSAEDSAEDTQAMTSKPTDAKSMIKRQDSSDDFNQRKTMKRHVNELLKRRQVFYEPKNSKDKASQQGWVSGLNENDRQLSIKDKEPPRRSAFQEGVYEREAHKMGKMLHDPETMKERMKDRINKQDVQVFVYYKKDGVAQAIARSAVFDYVTLAVIFANTIWIAVDTEHNDSEVLVDAEPHYQITEHCFCLYFTLEVLIRFAAFESKWDCLKSHWFLFDCMLVAPMVFEDWILTVIFLAQGTEGGSVRVVKNAAMLRMMRILRLARLGRAIKLIRQSPEVMILVKAVGASARCVVWTCVLLATLMFFFGVCFTEMCKDTELQDTYFPSLTGSMHTLLIAGLFPDLYDLSRGINDAHVVYWIMFIAYLAMTTITVMNLLIGVLVSVAQHSAIEERDSIDVAYVKEVFIGTLHLQEVQDFSCITISQDEFCDLLQEPDILRALVRVGIDVLGLIDLMDFIFMNGPVVFSDFVELVLQLRSSAALTVRDLVEVRKFLTYEMAKIRQELSRVHTRRDAWARHELMRSASTQPSKIVES